LGQYLDRIGDGAEGLQIDGGGAHGLLDFNPSLTLSPDLSLLQGERMTMEEFLKRAREINPAVVVSLQDSFDRGFTYNEVSYASSPTNQDDVMAVRYTFPEWTIAAMSEQPGDFGL